MKTTTSTVLALATSLILVTSCNDNTKDTTVIGTDTTTSTITSIDSMNMQSEKMNTGSVANSANDFVNTAAQAGMMEVEAGKIAQENSSASDVKAYGKMMEVDHTEAGNQLKSIAAANNMAVPTSLDNEHAAHIKELSAKKGADFDKTYIDMMVEGHMKVIEAFKKEAMDSSNADLKKFAAGKLPTLQGHLSKAKALKAKM